MRKQGPMDLLRSGGERLREAGREVWWAGLGTVAEARDRSRRTFADLVERGKRLESDERKRADRAVRRVTKMTGSVKAAVEDRIEDAAAVVLHRLGVPTHGEVRQLIQRVDQLSSKIQRTRAAR